MKLANASSGNTSEENQVRLCDYYDKKWEWIIRPKDNIINGLVFIASKLCDNNFVLYSQEDRLSLDKFLSKVSYDINQINKKLYCDCSSFVGTCIKSMGFNMDVAQFTTSTMRNILTQLGFKAIYFQNKSQIKKGDILLKEGSHTVLVVDDEDYETTGIVKLKDKNSYLNIREKPSSSSKVVGTLSHGEKVKITSQSGSWYYVNDKGYCSKSYIEA